MKTIKFRVWNENTNQMLYTDWNSFRNWCDQPTRGKVVYGREFDGEKRILSAPMQYIGLKDRNQKEIYECDFLEGNDPGEFGSILSTWIDVVVWDNRKAAFVCMDVCEGTILSLDETDSNKVVGNVHTRPELLQKIKKEFDYLRGVKVK